jgi:hypothetical protein
MFDGKTRITKSEIRNKLEIQRHKAQNVRSLWTAGMG